MAILKKVAFRKAAQTEELDRFVPYVDDAARIVDKYLSSRHMNTTPVNSPGHISMRKMEKKASVFESDVNRFKSKLWASGAYRKKISKMIQAQIKKGTLPTSANPDLYGGFLKMSDEQLKKIIGYVFAKPNKVVSQAAPTVAAAAKPLTSAIQNVPKPLREATKSSLWSRTPSWAKGLGILGAAGLGGYAGYRVYRHYKNKQLEKTAFKSPLAARLLGILKTKKKPEIFSSAGTDVIKRLQKLYPKSAGSFIRSKLREM